MPRFITRLVATVLVSLLAAACSEESPAMVTSADERDLIVEGRYVVTMDELGTIIEHGAVAVRDGRIMAVGSAEEIRSAHPDARVIAGGNRILMPGLINGHTHSSMVLLRGLADDMDLMTWLTTYIFPMEGRFVDPGFIKAGARLACLEMIKGGTTALVDMYFHPEVAAQVFEACGLRAIVAAPMIDFPSPGFTGWDDSFAAALAFLDDWAGRNAGRSGRVTTALAPHAPYTVSPEHYKAALAAAKERGIPITTHVSEDMKEVTQMKTRYGTTSIQHLNSLGLLDHTLIAAHVVWPTAEEIALLVNKNVGVIHNPTSNLKLGAGFSPVPKMLAAGIQVGLGTDGAASNNDLDMWEEIRLAALIHKAANLDETLMPAETVLRMATSGGATAIGLGDVTGSLEVGKRGDMIQIALDRPHMTPIFDVISHLVYAVKSSDVTTSIVDGAVLMEAGQVLTLDEQAVMADANAQAAHISAALAAQ